MSTSYSTELRCTRAMKALGELKKLKSELKKLEESAIQKRKHKYWVNPLFLEKKTLPDLEAHLLKDILLENGSDYRNFCRMSIQNFEEILSLVELQIKKEDTRMRHAITPRVRLALSLRYIMCGDSYRSLEFLSHVSRKTISKFIPEVLNAIVGTLQSEYLKTPDSENEWLSVAEDFNSFWQFPHTIGALDGKQIRINSPPHSVSDSYNDKGLFSLVLLAVVDAHSRFLYIHVGANGRESDVDVLNNCSLCEQLSSGRLNIPSAERLSGQQMKTPFFFIGDDIFGLNQNLLKGYNSNSNLTTSQEIFNYRLSRARLTTEMAFGRLASRFRIFHRPIEISQRSCYILVKACCVLHNYLSPELQTTEYLQREDYFVDLPETFQPLACQDHDKYKYACEIRENVRTYCVTDGDVPFQWSKIKKPTIQN